MGRRQREAPSGLHAQGLPGRPRPIAVRPSTPGHLCACMLSHSGSDSLQPYGLYPAWPLCACYSPGKNTGVGVLVAQSCPTLCDLIDCSRQAPLSMGFSRRVPYHQHQLGSPLGHLHREPADTKQVLFVRVCILLCFVNCRH